MGFQKIYIHKPLKNVSKWRFFLRSRPLDCDISLKSHGKSLTGSGDLDDSGDAFGPRVRVFGRVFHVSSSSAAAPHVFVGAIGVFSRVKLALAVGLWTERQSWLLLFCY